MTLLVLKKKMKTISWFLFAVTQGCVIQPFVLFSCDGATWFNSFKINRKSCPTKFDNIWKFSRTQVSISLKLISHICVHVQWKVCQCVMHVTSYCQSLICAIKTKANMIKMIDFFYYAHFQLKKLWRFWNINPSTCLVRATSASWWYVSKAVKTISLAAPWYVLLLLDSAYRTPIICNENTANTREEYTPGRPKDLTSFVWMWFFCNLLIKIQIILC